MKTEIKNQLILEAASKVHEAWCVGEIRAFYSRFVKELEDAKTPREALDKACYKNGKKRNEIELDVSWIQFHETETLLAFKSFEQFKHLVDLGIIEVKRFTKRSLTKQEQNLAEKNNNYNTQTQEENILRPFEQLSADSQAENLQAARGAVYVYEEYAKRGVTLEQLTSEKAKRAVGTLIHADWMRRNEPTEANKHLFVPYNELDDWAKQQDLDVFMALIEEVKKDEESYRIEPEANLDDINPQAIETAVLNKKAPNPYDSGDVTSK